MLLSAFAFSETFPKVLLSPPSKTEADFKDFQRRKPSDYYMLDQVNVLQRLPLACINVLPQATPVTLQPQNQCQLFTLLRNFLLKFHEGALWGMKDVFASRVLQAVSITCNSFTGNATLPSHCSCVLLFITTVISWAEIL